MTPREEDNTMELGDITSTNKQPPQQPSSSSSSKSPSSVVHGNTTTTYYWVSWSELSRQERYDLVGWITFVASATFYTVAAIDYATYLGSLFFLLACFMFMIPMLRKPKEA
jgi:hypothetical protein